MRLRTMLIAGLALLAADTARSATGDVPAYLAEIAKLDGKFLSIRTTNGRVTPGMSAEFHAAGPASFTVVTSIKGEDDAVTLFARESYDFQMAEPGLSEGHFKTAFARSNGGKVTIPLSCDTFLFAGRSLQLDCYRPENFRAERKMRLEITIIWDLKPESFDIRVITQSGAATLSAAR